MTDSAVGAPWGAGTAQEARDATTARGPSRVPSARLGLERIRTIIVEEHEDIARLVASRIATLVRERAAAGQRAVLGHPCHGT